MASTDLESDRPVSLRTAGKPQRLSLCIRSLILLSGSLRAAGLSAAAINRSPLDLPVDSKRSLLSVWQDAATRLACSLGRERLPVRILAARETPAPLLDGQQDITFEHDPAELRGTGGILCDASVGYQDHEYILVANAAQVLIEPLGPLIAEMAGTGGDAVLVAHDDGTPSGLMLIRCACLRLLPAIGFCDMKEQALPIIAKQFCVRVIRQLRPTGLPVRTPSDYVAALRRYHSTVDRQATIAGPFAEDWYPKFAIVEQGAEVAAGACIHDSVVLRGGRVERGATVVRSVVCPGGVVRRNRVVLDQLISPLGKN